MLRLGCLLLTAWTALNLAASAMILIDTLWLGGHTPALHAVLSPEAVAALEPQVLLTVDSIAVFANGMNAAFSIIALVVVWRGLHRARAKWAYWGLLAGFTAAVIAGVAADSVVGWAAPQVNVISAGILAAGFAFAGYGLFGARASLQSRRKH